MTEAPQSSCPEEADPTPASFTLPATDGYPLGATRFAAQGDVRGHLVVAGATGVPQRFYRRFAQFAARQGLETLTFDYRGIGLSKHAPLRGFDAGYLDWARRDLAAAVDAMAQPGRPLYLVGHSFGGHAFGLLPAPEKISAFHGFGVGAGWHGWMPRGERLRVLALWHLVGPALTRWSGYLPWSRLGMGEDLPLGVYRDWRRWCAHPHYFFDDPAMAGELYGFERVRVPLVATNATDDLWAPPRSRDAFVAGYRHARVQRVDLDPLACGFGPIGHMGYFRPAAMSLWRDAVEGLLAATSPGQPRAAEGCSPCGTMAA